MLILVLNLTMAPKNHEWWKSCKWLSVHKFIYESYYPNEVQTYAQVTTNKISNILKRFSWVQNKSTCTTVRFRSLLQNTTCGIKGHKEQMFISQNVLHLSSADQIFVWSGCQFYSSCYLKLTVLVRFAGWLPIDSHKLGVKYECCSTCKQKYKWLRSDYQRTRMKPHLTRDGSWRNPPSRHWKNPFIASIMVLNCHHAQKW